jgi:hypothetical protein
MDLFNAGWKKVSMVHLGLAAASVAVVAEKIESPTLPLPAASFSLSSLSKLNRPR